jgi:ElaB/YqjD/DUF883 family membrane-anchored ribosome-binding protein
MAERKKSKSTTERAPKPRAGAASRPGTSGAHAPAGDDPSQSPDRIEAEIEQSREELGETAAALAEKADVKQQAQQKVEETKEAARARVSATADAAKEKLQTAPEAASQTMDRTVATLRENPAPAVAAIGGLLVVAVIMRRRRR